MIGRRALTQFGVTALVAWPFATGAQQPAKTPRIGFLALGTPGDWLGRVEGFRACLRELGYLEGKNLVIEFRWVDTVEQLQRAADELPRYRLTLFLRHHLPRPSRPDGRRRRSLLFSPRMPTLWG